jgi:thiosulfate reductase cytochrome b subunit
MNGAKNSLFLASSVLMFWGLARALRFHKPGVWLLFWLMLLYPAIYYVVFPSPRYRVPIEPEMTILCVFVLTEAGKRTMASRPDRSSERGSG